jgi:hypothetical protein
MEDKPQKSSLERCSEFTIEIKCEFRDSAFGQYNGVPVHLTVQNEHELLVF